MTNDEWTSPYDSEWSADMHKSLRERIKQLRMESMFEEPNSLEDLLSSDEE